MEVVRDWSEEERFRPRRLVGERVEVEDLLELLELELELEEELSPSVRPRRAHFPIALSMVCTRLLNGRPPDDEDEELDTDDGLGNCKLFMPWPGDTGDWTPL